MVSSSLHAIAVAELRYSNPAFYEEYCQVVEGISDLIRNLAEQHADNIGFTSFTETFDHASNEPVLQIAIGVNTEEIYQHVYIHKDHHFVISNPGGGQVARTAEQAIKIIAEKLNEII